MLIDPELEEILLRWDEQRGQDDVRPIEELCRDRPHRLDEARRLIRCLERLDGLIDEEPDTATEPGALVDDAAIPPNVETGTRCRVERLHARGGLGEVFVAWDEELGRKVALKLIQRPFENDLVRRERFLREAEITARLGHPGIVPVLALGRTGDGRPCYTMRYIEGETLREAIRRFHDSDAPGRDARERTLAFRGMISRLMAVCQAVAFAHSRGVIHRDLKPDNIMLGAFGETLVVDWGLARCRQEDSASDPPPEPTFAPEGRGWRDTDSSLTCMGSVLGTPSYMSPEQAAGRWDEVGPASDVYSLGATLYVILTGRPPFQNRSRSALLAAVRRGEFRLPEQVKSGTPRALAAVCQKAMGLRPCDRYAGAAELADDLERWLADEPVSAWREPVRIRLSRWLRSHAPLVAASTALAVTGLAALGVSTLLLGWERTKTASALVESEAHYRLARATMSDMQTSFGLAAAERGTPAEAALWFAEAASTADRNRDRAPGSRIRVRSWARISPKPVALLEFPPSSPSASAPVPRPPSLAFAGRGRFLLAVSKAGACVLHDVVADRPIALPGEPRNVTAAAASGDFIALGGADGVVDLIRVPDARVVERLPLREPITSLEFSSDGSLLAIGAKTSRVWNVAKREFASLRLCHPNAVVQLAFGPQADRLATATADGRVRVFDLSATRTEPLFETGANMLGGVRNGRQPIRTAFADNGRTLLTMSSDRELVWLDAQSGAVIRRVPVNLMAVYQLLVSADGKTVAATGLGGVRCFDAATGAALGGFGEAGIEAAAFLPDGAEVLVSSGYSVATVHRIPNGDPAEWVLRHHDVATGVAVAQDGAHFAIAQHDGLVRAWRFPQREATAQRGMPSHSSMRLALSDDGRLVMPLGRTLSQGDSSTRVHDLSTGRIGPELNVDGILHGGAIAPDDRRVVTLSSPAGVVPAGSNELLYPVGASHGWVTFWDWERGVPLWKPIRTPTEPIGAAYSPDGGRVVVLCVLGECLWIDPAIGRVVRMRKLPNARHQNGWPVSQVLRFSPDGTLLYQWGAGAPVLFDARTGDDHSPALSPVPQGLLSARFSPDGRYLATAGGDKTARVWDLANGREAAAPLVHPDWVFQAVFSADGTLLLTGSRDTVARVWNWRTGTLAGPPLAHPGEVQDVGFLNGDRWVLTKSSDRHMINTRGNAVQLWNWASGKPLTPPRLFPSVWGSQLCIAPDQRRAVIGSTSNRLIHTINLADWIDVDDPEFPGDQLREIAELLSGQRIVGGSSVVRLTSAEWVARWRSQRAINAARPTRENR